MPEIHAACRAAAIHEKIRSFPRGVRDPGDELPWMRRPRGAAQRALFAAGDSGSGSGSGNRKKRATLVIAHRLSTVVRADLICVLHEGRIVERGTPEGLLKERGRYFGLWWRQLIREEEEEVSLREVDGG
ncbi:hypothetical protein BP00DRAFT_443784 [Aspergillus indologenus CBS 114.80]|uniref:P-loop containing nucleoside triphosphate hydrolase protein n=1 Tax=Aspergillus indologenus CBS 114.80 TaxID=1450541 RepID=A0A2V5IGS2_9EURO|nr:hypothetical protein BP00DRAFT_443784 [Aspergillus indologenus CBS 114.80]